MVGKSARAALPEVHEITKLRVQRPWGTTGSTFAKCTTSGTITHDRSKQNNSSIGVPFAAYI